MSSLLELRLLLPNCWCDGECRVVCGALFALFLLPSGKLPPVFTEASISYVGYEAPLPRRRGKVGASAMDTQRPLAVLLLLVGLSEEDWSELYKRRRRGRRQRASRLRSIVDWPSRAAGESGFWGAVSPVFGRRCTLSRVQLSLIRER